MKQRLRQRTLPSLSHPQALPTNNEVLCGKGGGEGRPPSGPSYAPMQRFARNIMISILQGVPQLCTTFESLIKDPVFDQSRDFLFHVLQIALLFCLAQSTSFCDMDRLSKDERIKVVRFYLETRSIILTQRKFKRHFSARTAPTRKTILRITEKFIAHGTVQNQNKSTCGPKRTVSTSQTIKKLADAVRQKPKSSVRRLAKQTRVSRTTTHRLLKKTLGLTPYKITVHQSLTEVHCEERIAFCMWLKQKCDLSEDFINNLWFSDEAHFHLNGQVNRQNCRFWGKAPPDEVLQRPLHSPKVTVWCALSGQGIVGPFFFEDRDGSTVTINKDRYISILNKFWRALEKKCADTLHQQWMQQDGATSHTAGTSLEWMSNHFEDRFISRRSAISWPAHSSDLTP